MWTAFFRLVANCASSRSFDHSGTPRLQWHHPPRIARPSGSDVLKSHHRGEFCRQLRQIRMNHRCIPWQTSSIRLNVTVVAPRVDLPESIDDISPCNVPAFILWSWVASMPTFLDRLIALSFFRTLPKRQRRREWHTNWFVEAQVLESRVLLTAVGAGPVAAHDLVAYAPLGEATPQSTAGPTGYTPSQLKAAYGFDKISFNGIPGDGRNTTIAIVDAYNDPNIVNDLHQFDLQFGLPDPSLTIVNQNGSTSNLPATDSGWITEIALDVEWAHAMAPGASILLVEANSASYSDLMTAVNTARNYPGVVAVSMSWGGSEFSGETGYDSYFTTPANHKGVAFVASSGDTGAPADYPGSSPNVLTVGGTTLFLNGDNS